VVEESVGVQLAPVMPNVVPEDMEDMLADFVEDDTQDQEQKPDSLVDTALDQQPIVNPPQQHKKKHKKTRADVLVVAGDFQKLHKKPSRHSHSVHRSPCASDVVPDVVCVGNTATGATSDAVSTADDVAPALSTSLGSSVGRAHSQSMSCESDAGEFLTDDDDSLRDSDFDIQAAVAPEDTVTVPRLTATFL